MDANPAVTRIGFLAYPGLTQLDLTGPLEVLARLNDVETPLVAKTIGPVRSDRGLALSPDATLADCPPLDALVVPGGPCIGPLMDDAETLDFMARQAGQARYICGVCTGVLLLGAAGLLRGRRATTHWLSLDLLDALGALPSRDRVVQDGPIITSAGVTAGLDLALILSGLLRGEETAREITLQLQYDPQPPFACGNPWQAEPALVERLRQRVQVIQDARARAVARAAARIAALK